MPGGPVRHARPEGEGAGLRQPDRPVKRETATDAGLSTAGWRGGRPCRRRRGL